MVIDKLRTVLAKFIFRDLTRPRQLVIRAWLWLAAETDALDEQRRCLEAVLELNSDSQAARAGLARLHQRQIKEPDHVECRQRLSMLESS